MWSGRLTSAIVVVLGCVSLGNAYSKYGRSCKDIGCLSNEVCVMESDPCSYYQRQNECGSYPTCKKVSSNSRTCATYVCPPGTVCQMSGNNPKCVDDSSKKGRVGYDTQAIDSQSQPQSPNAPVAPSAPVYPNLPRGETTPRPNVGPGGGQGYGYQGGQIGSGYPGQPGGYPQQNGGYPQQNGGSGYRQPSYPGYGQNGYQQPGNYPGYQQNGGGYQQSGGGYQQPGGGYQQPGGYPGYNNQNQYQNRYGQKNTGSSISDQLGNTLKNIGTNLLKDALGKLITGATNRN